MGLRMECIFQGLAGFRAELASALQVRAHLESHGFKLLDAVRGSVFFSNTVQ